MPARRDRLEISLEEDFPSAGDEPPRRLTLTWQLTPPEEGTIPWEEIRATIEELRNLLKASREVLVPPEGGPWPTVPHEERSLEELLETYRPRSKELVDALLWEGQLTPTEHERLLQAVTQGPARREGSPPRGEDGGSERPPSQSPSSRRGGRPPRSPQELVAELHLQDLKDANRARFQRLISYEEWVRLKEYFASGPPSSVPP
jgi:hypothetical protein